MKPVKNTTPLRTTLIYLIFSAVWILISDQILNSLFPATFPHHVFMQTIKGWFFVLVSSALIYLIIYRDIQSLHESEERYRGIFENSGSNILIIDVNGIFLMANKNALNTFGLPARDLIGKSIFDLLPKETAEKYLIMNRKLLERGGQYEYEDTFDLPGGRQTFLIIDQCLKDAKGVNYAIQSSSINITERKNAEDALKKSEQKWVSLVRTVPDFIALFDKEGKYLFLNHYIEGYSEETAIGKHYSKFISGESEQRYTRAFSAAQQSGQTQFVEYSGAGHNGETRHYDSYITPIIENGEFATMLVLARDITERKDINNALQKSEQLLSEAQRIGRVGHWEWTAPGRNMICSDELLRIFEMPPGIHVISQLDIGKLMDPEDQIRLHEIDHQIFKDRADMDYEFRIILSDGRVRWIHQQAKITYGKNGAPIRMMGIMQDITERKEAEEALRLSELRFRSLIEHGQDHISLLDADGTLLWENPAAIRTLGYQHDQFKGQNIFTLVHPDDLKSVLAQFKKIASVPGLVERASFRLKNINNEWRWVEGIGTNLLHEASVKAIVINYRDITERKQAEDALHESEERFHKAFSSAPVAMSITNEHGNYVDANHAFCALVGFSREELINKTSLQLKIVSPEQRRQYTQIIREEGYIHNREMTLCNRSGENLIVLGSMETIEISHETCVLSTAIDITGRKTAEQKLQESEKRYRLISENSADVIWTLDLATQRFTYVSPSVFNLRGLTPEEVMAEPMQASMTPASFEHVSTSLPRRINAFVSSDPSERTNISEVEQVRKDGTIIPTEVVTNLLTDENGRVTGVLGISRDITERKQAEELIRKTEKHFRALIEKAPDGIVMLNKDSNFVYASPSARMLFGYGADDILDTTNPMENTHPEDIARVLSALQGMLQDPTQVPTLQYRFKHKNGSWRWVESTFRNLLNDPVVNALVINFRDISERKQAEEKLMASEAGFRRLFEAAKDGILILDAESGTILDANPFLVELLGTSRADILNKELWELGFFKDIAANKSNFIELQQKGYIRYEDLPLETAHGQRLNVEFISNIYEVQERKVVQCNIRDITERRRSELLIHRQSEQLRLLYEASHQLNRTLDLHEIYQAVCDFMSTVAPNDGLFISAYSPETRLITCRAYWLEDKWLDVSVFPPIELEEEGKGTQSMVIRTGKSMLLNDYQDYLKTAENIYYVNSDTNQVETSTPPEEEITRSALIVPLKTNGLVTGAIQVSSYRANAYTEDQLKLLDALALHIASAESNALLYTQVQTELSERKQAEQALSQSEEKYRMLVQNMQVGVVVHNPDTSILISNPMASQLLGLSSDQMLGKTAIDPSWRFIREDESTCPLDEYPVNQALAKSTPITNLILGIIRADKEKPIWVQCNAYQVWDEAEQLKQIVVTFIDVTERRRAEELIYQYTDELETRVEKRTAELLEANHAKDEFLANMSHELRTPLNGILGFSETLLGGIYGSINEKQTQAVDMIQSSGQHLLNLINDILDVSRIESGKLELHLESIRIKEICQSSVVFCKQMANKKSITLECSILPPDFTIRADAKRIKQIVINLLNNAVKFTPENGKVRIETREDIAAGQMIFSVTDTGIGISSEDQQKLFKPFVQLDSKLSRQYEGSGLGLALVKKLVEMHGGTVGLESEPGRGSRFYFTIPLHPTDTTRAEDEKTSAQLVPVETASQLKGGKMRILLVEDNATNMMVTSMYLNEKGYQVVEARNGTDALRHVQIEMPDLILMDIQMPGMSGLEVIKEIRSKSEYMALPIIALTALAMPGDRERCLEAGANEYMSKPVSLKNLVEMIKGMLQ